MHRSFVANKKGVAFSIFHLSLLKGIYGIVIWTGTHTQTYADAQKLDLTSLNTGETYIGKFSTVCLTLNNNRKMHCSVLQTKAEVCGVVARIPAYCMHVWEGREIEFHHRQNLCDWKTLCPPINKWLPDSVQGWYKKKLMEWDWLGHPHLVTVA